MMRGLARTDVGEDIRIRSGKPGTNDPFLSKLPGKAGNFAIVLLPLGDVFRTGQLRLFLEDCETGEALQNAVQYVYLR